MPYIKVLGTDGDSTGSVETEQPAANVLVPINDVQDAELIKRDVPIIFIKINGKTLQSLGLYAHLNGFEVVHDISSIGQFSIKFFDPQEKTWGLDLLREGSQVSISLGYEPDKMEDHGLFLLENPEFSLGRTGKYVEIKGFAPSVVMTKQGHQQKTWTEMSDSDIAQEMAKTYGLDVDIEETKTKFDYLVQAAESDYDFLMRRANYNGYHFFVDKKPKSDQGVLHFHRPRFVDTKKSLSINGTRSVIIDMSLAVQATRGAAQMYKAQIDWKHLKVHEATSKNVEDPLYQAALAQDPSLAYSPTLVQINPRIIQIHDGLLLHSDQLQAEMDSSVEANSTATRWIVMAAVKTVGLEFIYAGKVVRLKGAGKFDGPWLVMRVRHSYYAERAGTRAGFISEFLLKRTFNKQPTLSKMSSGDGTTSSPYLDITDSLQTEGEVFIS